MPPTLNRPPRPAVMKAKPRWKVGKPTSRSFMRRVRPGQFSFQRRGTYFDRRPSNMEVFKLKRKINTLNADALRTKRDHAAERARLEEELRDYRLSPLTQVRNQAKGVFEAVDKASSPFTPSVNGIDGFPQIGEGTSKALASRYGFVCRTVFNRESGMMLGSPIPVQLPYDPSEDRLIVRRQNKLARDIDIIQQKIRNNVYSAARR